MHRRAREILTSIAAAGIGGAIGSLVGKRRSRPRGREWDAIPDEIDGIDTTPTTDVEVIILEARLPDDDEVFELSIVDPPGELEPMLDQGRVDQGDDRADGENWIEGMLEDTAGEVPAERPL